MHNVYTFHEELDLTKKISRKVISWNKASHILKTKDKRDFLNMLFLRNRVSCFLNFCLDDYIQMHKKNVV